MWRVRPRLTITSNDRGGNRQNAKKKIPGSRLRARIARRVYRFGFFAFAVFRATAAFTSALNAAASTFSPS